MLSCLRHIGHISIRIWETDTLHTYVFLCCCCCWWWFCRTGIVKSSPISNFWQWLGRSNALLVFALRIPEVRRQQAVSLTLSCSLQHTSPFLQR